MQTTGREDRLPFPRSWWIDPGRIIGGRYPGTADVAESRAILAQLLDVGVRLVVNLQEVVELGQGERPFRDYAPDLLGLAAERGVDVQVRRFPVPDMGVPDAGQMGQILHEMAAAVTDGRRAYVHCWGGHGRTGMVAGCWLLAGGQRHGGQSIAPAPGPTGGRPRLAQIERRGDDIGSGTAAPKAGVSRTALARSGHPAVGRPPVVWTRHVSSGSTIG